MSCMVSLTPDQATDYIAIILSTVVCASLWGLFLYEYLVLAPVGEVPNWLMYAAMLFTLVAAISLFGYEKVNKALKLRR